MACGKQFSFDGTSACPFCGKQVADGVPLSQKPGLLDKIIPSRRDRLERANNEFDALRESWVNESTGVETPVPRPGTQFEADLHRIMSLHNDLLDEYRADIEKFLIGASVRLAKHDGEYSWEYQAKLDEEVRRLLDHGILAGKVSNDDSIGFLARCSDAIPKSYSRKFLRSELERRFNERRLAPRPDFQLTLDYAKRLEGVEFEQWLERLLRDNGISTVRTQQSRDQGADLIVEIGQRKIVIQAKQYPDAAVGNAGVQEAHAAKGFYEAFDAWVVTTSTFSRDAQELAFRLGVTLVPGSQLLNLPTLLLSAAASQSVRMPAAQTPIAAVPDSHHQLKESTSADAQESSETRPSAAEYPPLIQRVAAPPPIPVEAEAKPGPVGRRRRWLAPVAGCMIAATAIYPAHQQITKAGNKHAIQTLLDQYQTGLRTKDLAAVGECYAPVLEQYYLAHNVPRERVEREIGRAFARYESIAKLSLANVVFEDMGSGRATATLDKEWDFRGVKGFAGSEKQEMVFLKNEGRWQIASEKEVRVYWVHNPR